jgi:hypothetical protein
MLNRAPRLLLALAASAAFALAQEAPPAASPATSPAAGRDAPSIVLAPKSPDYVPAPPSDSDGVTRSVSPGIAAALSSQMPKYNPPTPTPVPIVDDRDMRDIDKPKNDIPRLPKFVVHEQRPPIFTAAELLTPTGLINLSIKRHPGLAFGNILGLNDGVAADMYYADKRLIDMEDLADTAHAMARGGDTAEARYILQETKDTYMAPVIDDSWNGPGPGGGFSGGGSK